MRFQTDWRQDEFPVSGNTGCNVAVDFRAMYRRGVQGDDTVIVAAFTEGNGNVEVEFSDDGACQTTGPFGTHHTAVGRTIRRALGVLG